MDDIKNFAKATIAGPFEEADTEITVLTGQGTRFATPPFNAVIWNATDYPDPSDDPIKEIVRITDITDDTLTITRAQEGTAAEDHNEAGKTYNLAQCITRQTIIDMIGDVFGFGPALTYDAEAPQIRLRFSTARFIQLAASDVELQSTVVYMGDFEAEGNNGYLRLDDSAGKATLNNLELATTQSASASVAVGTLAAKLPIYDGSGTLLGYIPIYNSIT